MDLREKMLEMLDNTRVEEMFGFSGRLLVLTSFAVMMKANGLSLGGKRFAYLR